MRIAEITLPDNTCEERKAGNPDSLHRELAQFNQSRLSPALIGGSWMEDLARDAAVRVVEGEWIEAERLSVARWAAEAPFFPGGFMEWFASLIDTGPGQDDPLFAWLADEAGMDGMRWFLAQEIAGEAGFDDLVAMTQVKFPAGAKLEMARNYWDEMGCGQLKGMHGALLGQTADALDLGSYPQHATWEALALSNLMIALAANRRYAYHAIGALGVVEMTAPGRVAQVNTGLKRLGVPSGARHYFALHASLDLKHSRDWNNHVIRPLAESDPAIALAIAEGALMRLSAGARCFCRYRGELGARVS